MVCFEWLCYTRDLFIGGEHMRKIKLDLLNGVIWQQILLFFFPVLFGTLFQQLYNTVDAIVVGNYIGKEALAAVGGSTGTLLNLVTGFCIGLGSGATVVVAQFYGNHSTKRVGTTVSTGMILSVSLGIVLTAAGIILAPTMLKMLNVPDDVFDLSRIYLRIFFLGLVPTLIYNTGAGVLRAIGDSRRPLYFLIASCIANIILDLCFVVIFRWGVNGAAAATVISQCISCFLTLFVLGTTDDCYHFSFQHLSFDKQLLKQIVVIGLPSGIQSCLYSVANLFIQSSVNTFGTDTVAAYTAFGKIDALFWNTSNSLGTAMLTFTGQNFGAGNIERVKKGFFQGNVIFVSMSLLISFICYFFGRPIYGLFTTDANVINIGVVMMQAMCPFWFTFTFVEIYSTGIRACGDPVVPMIMTALGVAVLRILWIIFYPAETILQVLTCYPLSWILTSILFWIYYHQGGWLKRCLRSRENIMKA